MKFDMLENCQAFVEALRTTFKIRQSSTPSPNDIVNGKNVRQLEICLQTFHRKFGKKGEKEPKAEEKKKKEALERQKREEIEERKRFKAFIEIQEEKNALKSSEVLRAKEMIVLRRLEKLEKERNLILPI